MRIPLAVALVLAALAPAVEAKKLKVSQDGPFTSIQEAVTAAAAGDTVEIAEGVYYGSVFVGGGRDGLTIRGKGDVIVDAWTPGTADPGDAWGIAVGSSDVKIEDLTVRHCRFPTSAPFYPGIDAKLPGLRLDNVSVLDAEMGIVVEGGAALIEGCEVVGGGIQLEGDDNVVRDTVVRNARFGILCDGDRVTIKKCAVRNIITTGGMQEGAGIRISGAAPVVTSNAIENVAEQGIFASGEGGVFKKNVVRNAGSGGMYLSGAPVVVDKNVIESVGLYGLDVVLSSTTDRVRQNQIGHVAGTGLSLSGSSDAVIDENEIDGCSGVGASIAASNVRFEQNEIRNASSAGISIAYIANVVELVENVVEECGGPTSAGISVDGFQHVLLDNEVRDGGGDGIRIVGKGITVMGNEVADNQRDGIDVEGLAALVTILENEVTGNGAEGLDNSATNEIVVRDNEFAGNRIDVANNGAFAQFEKNDFETGGPATAPDID